MPKPQQSQQTPKFRFPV